MQCMHWQCQKSAESTLIRCWVNTAELKKRKKGKLQLFHTETVLKHKEVHLLAKKLSYSLPWDFLAFSIGIVCGFSNHQHHLSQAEKKTKTKKNRARLLCYWKVSQMKMEIHQSVSHGQQAHSEVKRPSSKCFTWSWWAFAVCCTKSCWWKHKLCLELERRRSESVPEPTEKRLIMRKFFDCVTLQTQAEKISRQKQLPVCLCVSLCQNMCGGSTHILWQQTQREIRKFVGKAERFTDINRIFHC